MTRQMGETTHVSVTPDGGNPDDRAFNPSISDDGRYVGFASKATNLVAGSPEQPIRRLCA
jgi:Tol biopolymer transport system component